jgi:radical SAM-linked protein
MPLVRIEFEKKGRVRYISHLDLIRLVQRAVRRAEIPVEYTKGFNPHAKISYGPALALGIASSGEYMDVQLKSEMEVEDLIDRLNRCFPQGIKVIKARNIPDNALSLAAIINAAYYSIEAEYQPKEVESVEKIKGFFSMEHAYFEKTNKKGKKRQVDIMPMIFEVKKVEAEDGKLTLEIILETGSTRNLKPDDLLGVLKGYTKIELKDINIYRKKLLIKRGDKYYTPFQIFD